jgi:opacity protein-like surface antigen
MAKSPSPDKWQIFGGYTLQRDYGMSNLFSFNATCDATEFGCDFFAPFNSNGGQAAVSYFPKHHLGITAQMTFETSGTRTCSYCSEDDDQVTSSIAMQSYLFGPTYRYAIYGGKASLFYHVLVGISHNTFNTSSEYWTICESGFYPDEVYPLSCSSNNFTVATGGGVDFRLTRHISVRPAQLEYWTEQIPWKNIESPATGQSEKFGVDGLRYSAGAVFNF